MTRKSKRELWRLLDEVERTSGWGELNITSEIVTLTEETPDPVDVPEGATVLETESDVVTVWMEPES